MAAPVIGELEMEEGEKMFVYYVKHLELATSPAQIH